LEKTNRQNDGQGDSVKPANYQPGVVPPKNPNQKPIKRLEEMTARERAEYDAWKSELQPYDHWKETLKKVDAALAKRKHFQELEGSKPAVQAQPSKWSDAAGLASEAAGVGGRFIDIVIWGIAILMKGSPIKALVTH
jgi:hypothetical protein